MPRVLPDTSDRLLFCVVFFSVLSYTVPTGSCKNQVHTEGNIL
nr:MAG TPA: hypothetical protein [Caudoviricetes sp.]